MQKENYTEAEAAYRHALQIGADSNKVCNLGICLMKQGRIAEAKETLKQVQPTAVVSDGLRGVDSHLKAFERAQEMLRDLEAKLSCRTTSMAGGGLFEAFLGSSSIWQPQPCVDYLIMPPPPPPSAKSLFADENANTLNRAALNIDAPPFFSSKLAKPLNHDALANLKRTRSSNAVGMAAVAAAEQEEAAAAIRWPELPDNKEFDEAIVAALLGPVLEEEHNRGGSTLNSNVNRSPGLCEEKMGKRLRIFQDITQEMNSPK